MLVLGFPHHSQYNVIISLSLANFAGVQGYGIAVSTYIHLITTKVDITKSLNALWG